MMPPANIKMYKGWPGDNTNAICCNHPIPGACPNHWAMEAGASSKLEAKIAGITPAMLIFSGK